VATPDGRSSASGEIYEQWKERQTFKLLFFDLGSFILSQTMKFNQEVE
jgi:hypothetical protein